MDRKTRKQIARFMKNIIAPGNCALFPYELEQAIRKIAAKQPISIQGKEEILGEFWVGDDADPLRQEKVHMLKAKAKSLNQAYKTGNATWMGSWMGSGLSK